MLIAVLNKSSLVSDAQLNIICLAIQKQLDLDFLPAWNLKEGSVATFRHITYHLLISLIFYINNSASFYREVSRKNDHPKISFSI